MTMIPSVRTKLVHWLSAASPDRLSSRPPVPLIWRLVMLVAALAIANLPFWLLSQVYAIERAQLNVDLLIALAIMAWRPALGLVAVAVAWLADAAVSQSMSYFFLSPAAFLDSMRFAQEVTWRRMMSPAVPLVALLFLASAACSWALARRRRPEWGMTVLVGLLLFALDTVNGSSRYALVDQRLVPMNIAGSPTVTLGRVISAAGRHDAPMTLDPRQTITGDAEVLAWARQHPERSVWLVLVESMGWPRPDALRQAVASGLGTSGAEDAYRIELRQLPFKGSTTSGELRALCGVYGSYMDLTPTQRSHCLPAVLAADGWTTSALHGFSGRMFDREQWWTGIGFESIRFKESLEDLPLCGGAFRGICDGALLRKSAALLARPQQFVYTLTLNTHLPLDPHPVPDWMQAVCNAADVTASACQLADAHRNVLAQVAEQARRLPDPKPLILVLGDHAPPFADQRSRRTYDQGTVPAFVLRPKDTK